MSEKSGFFDAEFVGESYDRVYLAEDFARYFSCLVKNGVFAKRSEMLQVRQNSTANMSVIVSTGNAWINGYIYENTSDLEVPISVADGVLDRVDSIVVRWNKLKRAINIAIKKGDPSSSAVAPAVQRDFDIFELKLAEIKVPAGTVAISQSMIFDTRTDTEVCGWVTQLIDQVDTHTLFIQWESQFDTMFSHLQDLITQASQGSLLDGSVTESKIASGAVTSKKIKPGAITAEALADESVTEKAITDGSVTSKKLASNAVNDSHINSVDSSKLTGVVPITHGGTGETSAQKALTALLKNSNILLSNSHYGSNLPPAGTKGRLFFKKV